MTGDPDFGPRGYLPARAAQRARKIVLRERMGVHWVLAAVAAGVVIAVVAGAVLLARSGPPGGEFVAAGPLDAIDPRGAAVLEVAGTEVLVVRAGGALRAFVVPADAEPEWCPASQRLEDAAGEGIWTLQGRQVGGGGSSLAPVPVQAYDGVVHLAVGAAGEPLPAAPATAERGC